MLKLRVIVGGGTAAQIYRSTADPTDYLTVVLGSDGLWARVTQQGAPAPAHGGHRMGQPEHLIHLPGQQVPAFGQASGQTPLGMQGFMPADAFQARVRDLAGTNTVRDGGVTVDCRVTRIERRPGGIGVTTSNPAIALLADQVVVASGIGPQRGPPPVEGDEPGGLDFEQIQEGVSYLVRPERTGQHVFVYGGGATAAWVAQEVSQRARQMLWTARLGGSGFGGSVLPGDRNFQILQATEANGSRFRATVRRLRRMPAMRLGGRVVRRPMVRVDMQAADGDRVCMVDQFIYALGGAPGGGMAQLIDNALLGELAPFRDTGRVISGGDGVLAWATPDQRVLVVGAATFNMAPAAHGRQQAPMTHLPRNAQVPDGIAMISSAMSAMHDTMPLQQDDRGQVVGDRVNLNIGDRNQVAAWIAVHYPDLTPAAANMAVDGIVGHRAQTTFGLTQQEIDTIVQNSAALA